MIADLVPDVEAMTGRRFTHRPIAKEIRRRDFRNSYVIDRPRLFDDDPEREERRLTDSEIESLSGTIAVYSRVFDGIRVISESVRDRQKWWHLTDAEVQAYVRCTMVHELTHALQHQYGVRPRKARSDRWEGWDALIEGHAAEVEYQWCLTHEGRRIADLASQNTMLASSRPFDDSGAPYTFGRMLVHALNERNPDLVWSALASGVPPSWKQIRVAVEGTRLPGWDDPAPLEQAIRDLGLDPGEYEHSLITPTGVFKGRLGLDVSAPAIGGLTQIGGRQKYAARAATMAFAEPGVAKKLVRMRLDAVRAWDGSEPIPLYALHPPPPRSGRVSEVPKLARAAPGAEAHLVTVQTLSRPYRELWVADQRSITLLVAVGLKQSDKALSKVMQDLLDAHPPVIETLPFNLTPLRGWLDVVERTEPLQQVSYQYLRHRAAADIRHGDDAPCPMVYEGMLTPGLEPSYPWSAMICSVATRDWDFADRSLAAFDSSLPPNPAGWLASKALANGSPALAVQIIDLAGAPSDPPSKEHLALQRLRQKAREACEAVEPSGPSDSRCR